MNFGRDISVPLFQYKISKSEGSLPFKVVVDASSNSSTAYFHDKAEGNCQLTTIENSN